MQNHYATLKLIPFQASQSQIKQSYRQLMLIHHPDKTSDIKLIDKGIEIIHAYNVLSNQLLKKQYDEKIKSQIYRIKNSTNRHFDIVETNINQFDVSSSKDIESNGTDENSQTISIDCNQCLGETEINCHEINELRNNQTEIFINCIHCGLLMKIE